MTIRYLDPYGHMLRFRARDHNNVAFCTCSGSVRTAAVLRTRALSCVVHVWCRTLASLNNYQGSSINQYTPNPVRNYSHPHSAPLFVALKETLQWNHLKAPCSNHKGFETSGTMPHGSHGRCSMPLPQILP